MTNPPAVTSDIVVARWAKRALTYGATVVAGVSAGLYFLFQTANQAALSPFGLDPSGFSGSTAEMIGGGLGSLFILLVIMFALYWPIGRPAVRVSGWIAGKYLARYGKPIWLTNLEAWITSEPTKQSPRALMVGATIIVPLLAFMLFWAGSAIGRWRVSQAEWLVSANGCANDCFAYKQEGKPGVVIGRPIAANSSRMAIVVGRGRIETVEVAKITSAMAHKGSPINMPKDAPWNLRLGWWILDILNANW